jgi:hypothetical protein
MSKKSNTSKIEDRWSILAHAGPCPSHRDQKLLFVSYRIYWLDLMELCGKDESEVK